MNKLTNLRINFERWLFRMKERIKAKRLERKLYQAIKEADQMKAVTGKKHYVLRLEDRFVVRSRYDKLIINKAYPRLSKLTNREFDKMTVYSTK